jgi:uncharacterized protein DUF3604
MKHLLAIAILSVATTSVQAQVAETELLFGDTHLHTSYSFDAYLNKNQTATPDTAYRWARGLPVVHPLHRARIQIETPLDFLVVSDHAELLGVIRAANLGIAEFEDLGLWGNLKREFSLFMINRAIEGGSGSGVFNSLLPEAATGAGWDPVQDPVNVFPTQPFGDTVPIQRTAWHEIVDAAEQHNRPGEFTTFMGWEWSSIPTGANLHRVVFSPDSAEKAKQYVPFGSDISQYPEDLWQWLEETGERTGSRFMAMPHNSNISKGYMFADKTLKGEPVTAEYAAERMRWEPVAEITQYKGDSETHPELSPDDEFADFESYTHYIQQGYEDYAVAPGDYVRSALKTGLALGQASGVNPYKFGLIGSTDSHSGLAAAEEDNFWGKFARDSTPETKVSEDQIGGRKTTGWHMAAAGLAAVYATGNTRDEIFAAFQRREVYATTGPRIKVRVFGGRAFPEGTVDSAEFVETGYKLGVPMGADLPAGEGAPQLLIRAERDPASGSLDRLQVVKGWVDAGGDQHEKVFNVAWAGDRQLTMDGSLPGVGNSVDLATGAFDDSIGAAALSVQWLDPEFDPTVAAFYYVRVLQIPTPRHSLLDAIALQSEIPDEGPATTQERAYTSPIWYTPEL